MPIVIIIKNAERIINVIIGIFLIAIGVLILTPLGFPYSGNPLSPAPQRFMIAVNVSHKCTIYSKQCNNVLSISQHAERTYYNANGSTRYSGTGFWIVDLDMNSPHSLESIVPEINTAIPNLNNCEKELYCGLPYLMPVTTFLR